MHKLSDYAGKKVILYFYPKDNTPGCTKQACGFSERYPQFTEKGAVILGVSKDSVASHKRFEEKYGLAFTLLADPAIQNPVLLFLTLTFTIPPLLYFPPVFLFFYYLKSFYDQNRLP